MSQDIGYHPYLAPEPAHPTCAVKASVYIGTQYFDAVALSKPTASPVPTVVMGAIDFQVENLLAEAIAPGWKLDIVLALGANLTELVNAGGGNETARTNKTRTVELIANHVDQTLEGRGGNSVEFGTHINASSQVRDSRS